MSSFNGQVGPLIVSDSLVGCWDASALRSLPVDSIGTDETWIDISKDNNDGTIENSPVLKTLNTNVRYVDFNGTDEKVEIPDNDVFSPTVSGAITVCCWANTPTGAAAVGNGGSGGSGAWFVAKAATSNYEWGFKNDLNTKLFFACWTSSGATAVYETSYTQAMNDGLWHFYCMVLIPATGMYGYLDGELIASDTSSSGSMSNTSSAVEFASRTGSYSDVNIGWVSIYNRSLSLAEIKSNYSSTKGRFA